MEPQPPTLSETIRKAVDIADPNGRSGAVTEFEERLYDRDEPVTAVAPALDDLLAEQRGALDPQREDPALDLTFALTRYLAHRRDEIADDPERLVRLALRAEYDDKPPEPVARWVADEGIAR